MLRCHVTPRAESRIGDFEQPIVHRPVRFVTIGTIFQHRWVFPKKGAAPFGMACITVFVNGVLSQLSWAWAAMRIMTVAAGHFSLADRHMRRAQKLRVSLQVTLTTNFRLRALGEKRRVFSDFGQLIAIRCFLHDRVASHATHPAVGMGTRIPVSLNSALMARQACLVLQSNRFATVFPKRN
jgi:hypothetical protein